MSTPQFSDMEIYKQLSDVQAQLCKQPDYHLPLSHLSFAREIIKTSTCGSYKYIVVENSFVDMVIHVLGTDCIHFHEAPLPQDYPLGRSLAWRTYTLSEQFSELEALGEFIAHTTAPNMWIESEAKLVNDYLADFQPTETIGQLEFVKINTYGDHLPLLTRLKYGTLESSDGQVLFVYPKDFRQALKSCCDIEYLSAWQESKYLSESLPAFEHVKPEEAKFKI
ncbi:hypothetical protein [Variovorax sp. W2I14]|uniref:hypothetical protein n=1 Tax=Variovorax sp. W2I14 TaxID=3042290 RepID=UPI003D19D55D